MSKPQEFCEIKPDSNNYVAKWVCSQLNFELKDIGEYRTLGFFVNHKLVGGLIYHNIRVNRDLWLTIYTTDKRWCNRRVLKNIFGLAYDLWKVERISLLVNTDNFECIKLVEKLGFKREGLLRKYRDDGSDCYFYGMLKSENIWKGKKS